MGYGYHKGAMKRTGMRPGMLLVDNFVDLPIFTIAVSDCWKVYHRQASQHVGKPRVAMAVVKFNGCPRDGT